MFFIVYIKGSVDDFLNEGLCALHSALYVLFQFDFCAFHSSMHCVILRVVFSISNCGSPITDCKLMSTEILIIDGNVYNK